MNRRSQIGSMRRPRAAPTPWIDASAVLALERREHGPQRGGRDVGVGADAPADLRRRRGTLSTYATAVASAPRPIACSA